MAARQKQDSQQEKAAERMSAVDEAMRASQHNTMQLPVIQMKPGYFVVTDTERNRPNMAKKAVEVKTVRWERKRGHCVVNDRMVFTTGGFAQVLDVEYQQRIDKATEEKENAANARRLQQARVAISRMRGVKVTLEED